MLPGRSAKDPDISQEGTMPEQPFMLFVLCVIAIICVGAFVANLYFQKRLDRKVAERQRQMVRSARFEARFGFDRELVKDERQRVLMRPRVRRVLDQFDVRLQEARRALAEFEARRDDTTRAKDLLARHEQLQNEVRWREGDYKEACELAREGSFLEGQEEVVPAA